MPIHNSNNNSPQEPPKRRRARQVDGTFKGDNPVTPLNEAWEPTELSTVNKPAGKYTIKPKVTGQTNGQESAGQYANNKALKTRPTFGTVTTTFH